MNTHRPTPAIIACTANDWPALVNIWESAVRTSHKFLSEDDIQSIRQALIPEYFPKVELHMIVTGHAPVAFIGTLNHKIEMLFVHADHQALGHGSALIRFAISRGARLVDVNEQNPQALGFYQSIGFKVISRQARDDAGRPFPILHMAL